MFPNIREPETRQGVHSECGACLIYTLSKAGHFLEQTEKVLTGPAPENEQACSPGLLVVLCEIDPQMEDKVYLDYKSQNGLF